jgi:hypothetical protein
MQVMCRERSSRLKEGEYAVVDHYNRKWSSQSDTSVTCIRAVMQVAPRDLYLNN